MSRRAAAKSASRDGGTREDAQTFTPKRLVGPVTAGRAGRRANRPVTPSALTR
ncbi:hypothetical protein OG542_24050 [Streptomyces violaceus]|uniref:hypothetical protein n=1 Tax=Streptomyces violaceus TaxID=1936 RepID=UPI002E1C9D03